MYQTLCTVAADGLVAEVVCASLGYSGGVILSGNYITPGPSTTPILNQYFYCGGSEPDLLSCYHVDQSGYCG